jgi:hypothetical protein
MDRPGGRFPASSDSGTEPRSGGANCRDVLAKSFTGGEQDHSDAVVSACDTPTRSEESQALTEKCGTSTGLGPPKTPPYPFRPMPPRRPGDSEGDGEQQYGDDDPYPPARDDSYQDECEWAADPSDNRNRPG